jgi:myosin V
VHVVDEKHIAVTTICTRQLNRGRFAMAASKKAHYDPWKDIPIWYCSDKTPDSLWQPGLVKKREHIAENEWKFLIEISPSLANDIQQEEFLNSDDEKVSISLITRSLDQYHLEYENVKKRDLNLIKSANQLTDMTSLSFLNEPEMIQCLKSRYNSQQIYTNIGPILIAINPFEIFDEQLYSIPTILSYSSSSSSSSKSSSYPHVYQITKNAYQKMFIAKYDPTQRENQSILVNGESGAGKTESTKQVLRYLSINSTNLLQQLYPNTSGESSEISLGVKDYEKLINAMNPITESFGNAKTSRNNNSSRFGKFIELCYNGVGYIIGSYIQTYLLETIRVTSQAKNERNFHIFYEIYSSIAHSQANPNASVDANSSNNCNELFAQHSRQWFMAPSPEPLPLESPQESGRQLTLEDFHYTNQSQEYFRYDNVTDEENYKKLLRSLSVISYSSEQIHEILGVVIGILHLGNIEFKNSSNIGEDVAIFASSSCSSSSTSPMVDSDTSSAAPTASMVDMQRHHLLLCCELFGIDEEILLFALTKREMKVAGNVILKNINKENAYAARDVLAKTIYDLLFRSLMEQVNQALSVDEMSEEETASFIGVLDIFGFEYFEKNSFEQLW